MELSDYLRMLRRGWRTVYLVLLVSLLLGTVYLVVAPRRYDATATILVSATGPSTITDLQLGSQYAVNAAVTYAQLIDTAPVLGPVADELSPSVGVGDLAGMIGAQPRLNTSLVDVTATSDDPAEAARVANAVATSARDVIPDLVATRSKGTPLAKVDVVGTATQPSAPLSPDTHRILALALILGLGLGLALTIARQALDTRLHRPEDVQDVTDYPILAALPHPTRAQRHAVVIVRDDPGSRAVEAYRSLRTNLSHLEDQERRSLLFTAVADDYDGVRVPVNVAWSIAQAGRRVLLVDLDLRQSLVGELLRVGGEQGLADVLAGHVDLDAVIHRTPQTGLDVLLSGTPQRSPSDTLSGPAMVAALRRMEQEYDYVILHAPPLLSYTDAAVMSRATGQTLVTVSAGRTRAQDLRTAMATLSIVHVEPLGLVLTGVHGTASDNSKVRSLWARSRSQPTSLPAARVSPDLSGEPRRATKP